MEETSLAELFRYSLLADRVKRLRQIARVSSEDLVPWIGAGISAAAGLPLWPAFLARLSEPLKVRDRTTTERVIKRGLLDLAADFIASMPEARIAETMTESFGSPPRSPRALRILRRMGCATVVTTNYDRIVESVMPWLVPLTPKNYRHAVLRSQPCLLKLHGTIEEPESWTLTRSQYVRRYNAELIEDLRHLFRHKHVLFLGCSLLGDMYLDLLREIPRGDLKQHFAVLCVKSDNEGKRRGEELQEMGIQVIPYMTTGNHSLVEELLQHLLPSFEIVSQRVSKAIDEKEIRAAQSLLRPWIEDPQGPKVRKQVAQLAAFLVERLARVAPHDALDDLSAQAIALDSTSIYALRVRAEFLESVGLESSDQRANLSALLQQTQRTISKGWRSSDKKIVREAYDALRAYDLEKLHERVSAIKNDWSISFSDSSDRLEVMQLRVVLAKTHPARTALLAPAECSPRIEPFARALTAYHQGQFTKALEALSVLEKRWRASSSGGYLAFSLQLKALCWLGLGRDQEAFTEVDRCYAAYIEPQARLYRKFRRVPVELSYDIRSIASPELYALIEFWRILAEINVRPEEIETARIEYAHEALVKCPGDDPLIDWCGSLAAVLHPGGERLVTREATESKLQRLLDETKKRRPGLLRDVEVSVRAIARSPYAPEWFEGFRQAISDAMSSP